MGYSEQISELASIGERARQLLAWINGDHGTYPPHMIIEAMTPRLEAIQRDLERLLWTVERRTVEDAKLREHVDSLVYPYETEDLMHWSYGKGAYALLRPPHQFWSHYDMKRFEPEAGGDISVAVYIDTDDEQVTSQLLDAVDQLVDAMGYDGPLDEQVEQGSLFRRSRAKAKQVLTSPELQARLVKIERAIEIAGIDLNQAEVDQREAEAVGRLLGQLQDVPRACVRAGSIVVAKFTTQEGPVVVARTLSQIEIRALEHFPEVQRNPEKFLEALVIAVENVSASVPELSTGDDSGDL